MRSRLVIAFAGVALTGAAWFVLHTGPSQETGSALQLDLANPASAEDSVSLAAAALDKAAAAAETGGNTPDGKTVVGAIKDSLNQIDESQDRSYLKAAPLSAKEVKSVRTLLGTFFKYKRGKDNLNKLIRELTEAGLDPVLAKDFNPYTGKMLTIRTNEALEGTRYYHAQFFEDDDKNKAPFRQHMSFEIRPSPDCMKVVKEIVEAQLGKKLGTPLKERGDDWAEWKKDGDSIWIQRLGAQDLSHDRFNARTIADVGTCRGAIEQIPDEDHSE